MGGGLVMVARHLLWKKNNMYFYKGNGIDNNTNITRV